MLEHGKYYHIFNRGNNREDLFYEEKNYNYFLKLYESHIEPIADTFAYCLMKNHFHLLVKIKETEEITRLAKFQKLGKSTPSSDPTQRFKNFFIAYSKAVNKAYKRTGALFEYPYKKIEVDSDMYFARLIHYIHFNPQRHGFTNNFRTYPHSSYQSLVSTEPTSLKRDIIWKWFGSREEFIQFHTNVSDEKEILKYIGDDK